MSRRLDLAWKMVKGRVGRSTKEGPVLIQQPVRTCVAGRKRGKIPMSPATIFNKLGVTPGA